VDEAQTSPPRIPDDAFVVRFGETASKTFVDGIKIGIERRGQQGREPLIGISVVCRPGLEADSVAALTTQWPGLEGRGLPHPRLQDATVGAIRARGYDVVADEPPPGHALVVFREIPSEDDRVNLLGAFSPLRDNPLGGA